MRYVIGLLGLLTLSGCGSHALDTPVKTCKAVLQVLAGNRAIEFQRDFQTEEKAEQLDVILDFVLQGENMTSQAICTYGLSSQDMDNRNAMGEYANTPTRMTINGKLIASRDLVQAVNRATAETVGLIPKK